MSGHYETAAECSSAGSSDTAPVTRPNQVWAMDLTYIPMARGFVYLAAVIDWFSGKVLSWRQAR